MGLLSLSGSGSGSDGRPRDTPTESLSRVGLMCLGGLAMGWMHLCRVEQSRCHTPNLFGVELWIYLIFLYDI
jgi:hypothetical protein